MPQPTTQRATDLHVDPSKETIRVGPLAVCFLLTGTTQMAAPQPLRPMSRAGSD
jgi:hypothetical protein